MIAWDRVSGSRAFSRHTTAACRARENRLPVIKPVDQILAVKRRDADADVSALEQRIDNGVRRLCGLTEEEIAIVEASTANRKSPAEDAAHAVSQ